MNDLPSPPSHRPGRDTSALEEQKMEATMPTGPHEHCGGGPTETHRHLRPVGIVAGAALHAARRSAGASESALATMCGVAESTIRSWEDGACPLASVPAARLAQLEAALETLGAEPRIVADLATAAWCDLVILAIADSTDAACLLADPLAATDAFRELLAWSLTGRVPPRYRPYAIPGPLLSDPTLTAQVILVLNAMPARQAGTVPDRGSDER